LHERVVCDGDIFPDSLYQFVFGNEAAGVANQVQQHVICLRPEPGGPVSSEKQLAPGIEREPEKHAPGRRDFAVVSACVRPHFVTRLTLDDYNGLRGLVPG